MANQINLINLNSALPLNNTVVKEYKFLNSIFKSLNDFRLIFEILWRKFNKILSKNMENLQKIVDFMKILKKLQWN